MKHGRKYPHGVGKNGYGGGSDAAALRFPRERVDDILSEIVRSRAEANDHIGAFFGIHIISSDGNKFLFVGEHFIIWRARRLTKRNRRQKRCFNAG